ncbi:MAG: hypothetical protein BGO40_10140 [Chryseobacterium sp. 39-10]|nr:MAG: hypothetical protein BGO40_10140 [Chryseobacterium sp. 39-10]
MLFLIILIPDFYWAHISGCHYSLFSAAAKPPQKKSSNMPFHPGRSIVFFSNFLSVGKQWYLF